MSLNRDKEYIPASIRTPLEGSPFWGRLLSIGPDRLELLSQFEFKKGKTLFLGFEFGGEKLEDVRGRVADALKDACGYFHYSITVSDHNQRKALLEKLIRSSART